MGGGGRYADLAEIYDELEYAESVGGSGAP